LNKQIEFSFHHMGSITKNAPNSF